MADEIVVRAEPTPNPDAMKFSVNRLVTDGTALTFNEPSEALLSPLARRLFAVPGVERVFLLKDFVTIRRSAGTSWDEVVDAIESALRLHFSGG